MKKGVWEKGGFPVEFPVMSLGMIVVDLIAPVNCVNFQNIGETLLRPTAMLYRNLVSMDVEESIRANPIDGVVLLTGKSM